MYSQIFDASIFSAILTVLLTLLLRKLGKSGKAGNLYVAIRGGIPRAVGLAPFTALLLFLPYPYNYLMAIMGFLAFIDDLTGRKKLSWVPIELGQLCRGLGILLVIIFGYQFTGPAVILVALMIQPLNIADMQPGSACTTVIVMSLVVILLLLLSGQPSYVAYLVPLITLAICLGYSPLDYMGKIMMGEVGNHSFAIALGISFFLYGGLGGLIALFIITVMVIAFIRRNNLQKFLEDNLNIKNPTFGDYFMDVLTGGGLGDFVRRILLKNRQIKIKNKFLHKLGFRRLFYNPYYSNDFKLD